MERGERLPDEPFFDRSEFGEEQEKSGGTDRGIYSKTKEDERTKGWDGRSKELDRQAAVAVAAVEAALHLENEMPSGRKGVPARYACMYVVCLSASGADNHTRSVPLRMGRRGSSGLVMALSGMNSKLWPVAD